MTLARIKRCANVPNVTRVFSFAIGPTSTLVANVIDAHGNLPLVARGTKSIDAQSTPWQCVASADVFRLERTPPNTTIVPKPSNPLQRRERFLPDCSRLASGQLRIASAVIARSIVERSAGTGDAIVQLRTGMPRLRLGPAQRTSIASIPNV